LNAPVHSNPQCYIISLYSGNNGTKVGKNFPAAARYPNSSLRSPEGPLVLKGYTPIIITIVILLAP